MNLWDLQVLFFNLFAFTEGHGNPCNTVLGVDPTIVEEFLFSANHDLLIPLIAAVGESDDFGKIGDSVRLYYHIM
jgi:hypothetical protein